MKKIIVWFVVLSLLFLGYFLYPKSFNQEERKPIIGISFDSLVVERWSRDLGILISEVEEQGYDVIVQVANDSLETQLDQVNQLIEEKVDVLIILPNDSNAFSELVLKAKNQGTSVIAYDRMINNAPVDLYISFDNHKIGGLMTEYVFNHLEFSQINRKNLVLINGDPRDQNSFLINEGIYAEINKGYPVNILSEVWATLWREKYAYDTIDSLLNNDVKIDAIIAANDTLAGAAIEALAARGAATDVLVVSQDAELSACQRIVEGSQSATIYKPINQLAKATIVAAGQLIEGELTYDEVLENGNYEVFYKKIDVSVVDLETIDDLIINSGFHSYDDVYRNVEQ